MVIGVEKGTVIAKVRKLLAVTEKTTFAHEAEAALLKAQELLVLHGLEVKDVTPEEALAAERVSDVVTDTMGREVHFGWLSTVITENFRCECYWLTTRRNRKIVSVELRIIGLAQDAEVAAVVYGAAVKAAANLAAQYVSHRKDCSFRPLQKTELNRIRSSFLAGFITGLSDKFKQQVAEKCWALALVKDEVVKKAYADLNPAKKRSRAEYGDDRRARRAGYNEGLEFDHARATRKKLGQGTIF